MSKSYEQWLTDVQHDGWSLEYVPELLIDAHLCQEAVHQNPQALRFVPDQMKSYALCLLAIREDASIMEYVPEAYLNDLKKDLPLV